VDTILFVSKLCSLAIAGAFVIFSTFAKIRDDRGHLTRRGRWTVGLGVASGLLSVFIFFIEDKVERTAAAAETQALRSLLDSQSQEIKQINRSMHRIGDISVTAIYAMDMSNPLLSHLAKTLDAASQAHRKDILAIESPNEGCRQFQDDIYISVCSAGKNFTLSAYEKSPLFPGITTDAGVLLRPTGSILFLDSPRDILDLRFLSIVTTDDSRRNAWARYTDKYFWPLDSRSIEQAADLQLQLPISNAEIDFDSTAKNPILLLNDQSQFIISENGAVDSILDLPGKYLLILPGYDIKTLALTNLMFLFKESGSKSGTTISIDMNNAKRIHISNRIAYLIQITTDDIQNGLKPKRMAQSPSGKGL